MAFSKLGQSLLDGKIDLIANNYWLTPDRKRLYAFTISRQFKIAAIQAMRELMADYIREPLRACLVWQSGSTHRIQVPVE